MRPSQKEDRLAWKLIGRVQGVGFRWWTRREARRLGVRGTVRNLPDGSVEIQAAGEPDGLDRFARAVRAGPPGARVDEVRPAPEAPDMPSDFRVLT